jgi:assimilatory nitrate reductase catalytic subunit
VDAISGQPEFKHTPAKISPIAISWRGFLAVESRKDPSPQTWWARTPHDTGDLYELSGLRDGPSLAAFVAGLRGEFEGADVIETSDSATRFARIAFLKDGRLIGVFAGSAEKGLPQRQWLIEQLGKVPDEVTRIQLLAGGIAPTHNEGAIVCACFGVTLPQIEAYGVAHPHADVNAIGHALKAGTNCGSCRGEILMALKSLSARKQEANDHANI